MLKEALGQIVSYLQQENETAPLVIVGGTDGTGDSMTSKCQAFLCTDALPWDLCGDSSMSIPDEFAGISAIISTTSLTVICSDETAKALAPQLNQTPYLHVTIIHETPDSVFNESLVKELVEQLAGQKRVLLPSAAVPPALSDLEAQFIDIGEKLQISVFQQLRPGIVDRIKTVEAQHRDLARQVVAEYLTSPSSQANSDFGNSVQLDPRDGAVTVRITRPGGAPLTVISTELALSSSAEQLRSVQQMNNIVRAVGQPGRRFKPGHDMVPQIQQLAKELGYYITVTAESTDLAGNAVGNGYGITTINLDQGNATRSFTLLTHPTEQPILITEIPSSSVIAVPSVPPQNSVPLPGRRLSDASTPARLTFITSYGAIGVDIHVEYCENGLLLTGRSCGLGSAALDFTHSRPYLVDERGTLLISSEAGVLLPPLADESVVALQVVIPPTIASTYRRSVLASVASDDLPEPLSQAYNQLFPIEPEIEKSKVQTQELPVHVFVGDSINGRVEFANAFRAALALDTAYSDQGGVTRVLVVPPGVNARGAASAAIAVSRKLRTTTSSLAPAGVIMVVPPGIDLSQVHHLLHPVLGSFVSVCACPDVSTEGIVGLTMQDDLTGITRCEIPPTQTLFSDVIFISDGTPRDALAAACPKASIIRTPTSSHFESFPSVKPGSLPALTPIESAGLSVHTLAEQCRIETPDISWNTCDLMAVSRRLYKRDDVIFFAAAAQDGFLFGHETVQLSAAQASRTLIQTSKVTPLMKTGGIISVAESSDLTVEKLAEFFAESPNMQLLAPPPKPKTTETKDGVALEEVLAGATALRSGFENWHFSGYDWVDYDGRRSRYRPDAGIIAREFTAKTGKKVCFPDDYKEIQRE